MYSHKESAAYIPSLEARLAGKANSPSFARLASYFLLEGQAQKGVDLCIEGLKHHPQYATARLVLGKCYDALGRNIEAMLEYRQALRAMPDNLTVQGLLRSAEQREQESFRNFAEERARTLGEQRETVAFEKYAVEDAATKETTAEFLLRRLQDVKKTAPRIPPEKEPVAEQQLPPLTPSKIVTATLAEIYASQGEFTEAIEAYKKLSGQRPMEAERYAKRIAQLEELRARQTEHQQ